jgi:hypothetical protein
MAIHIVHEPDVQVTESELARYKEEYRKFCSYYAGTPPTLEEFIRQSQEQCSTQSVVMPSVYGS